jgi:hypothetical protein
MILSRREPPGEQSMASIIETLAEKVYAHGHAFGFREANDAGLPVSQADDNIDDLMWKLLREYEEDLKLLQPLDVFEALGISDPYTEKITIACIESGVGSHSFSGTLRVEGQRVMPPNLNVTMNFPVTLPAGVDPATLQQELQAQLVQLQQAMAAQAQQAVHDALRDQAPLTGAQIRLLGGKWNFESH